MTIIIPDSVRLAVCIVVVLVVLAIAGVLECAARLLARARRRRYRGPHEPF